MFVRVVIKKGRPISTMANEYSPVGWGSAILQDFPHILKRDLLVLNRAKATYMSAPFKQ
jgi:hypothetical protein